MDGFRYGYPCVQRVLGLTADGVHRVGAIFMGHRAQTSAHVLVHLYGPARVGRSTCPIQSHFDNTFFVVEGRRNGLSSGEPISDVRRGRQWPHSVLKPQAPIENQDF